MLLWGGAIGVAAAIALLRFAWGRSRRSVPLNAAAWALMLAGLWAGGAAHGAWGVAVVSLTAMGAAAALLAHAAINSPARKSRASQRRVHLLPDRGEPLRIARRLASFCLAVPLAMLAALALALGARGLAGLAGWHEADGNVLALLLMPLFWAILATCILMARSKASSAVALVTPVLTGGLIMAVRGLA